MAYRWTTAVTNDSFILNVYVSGQIYHGADQSHVHALERVLGDIASARALELDNLYESVVRVEQEEASFKRFKAELDKAWNAYVIKNKIVVLKPTSALAEEPSISLCRVTGQQGGVAQYQAITADDSQPTRATTAATFVDMSKAEPFEIVNMATSLQLTPNVGPVETTTLSEMLQDTDAFSQRSSLNETLLKKMTIPMKVYTTEHGSRKRKCIDADPYGGPSKRWEFDAANISLDAHMRELKSIVIAVAKGLLPAADQLNQGFTVIYGTSAPVDLVSSDVDTWVGSGPDSVSFVMSRRNDRYLFYVNRTLSLNISDLKIGNVYFIKNEDGTYITLYKRLPQFLWYNKKCYQRRLLNEWRETGPGHGVITSFVPRPSAGPAAQALLFRLNDQSDIPLSEINFGESQSSILYDQVSTNGAQNQLGELFSEFPFSKQNNVETQFVNAVWDGFKDEMQKLHKKPFTLQQADKSHFMSSTCYHVQQASVPLADGPALQMSNGQSKWAIGANATMAADALVATLIYVQSKLSDRSSEW